MDSSGDHVSTLSSCQLCREQKSFKSTEVMGRRCFETQALSWASGLLYQLSIFSTEAAAETEAGPLLSENRTVAISRVLPYAICRGVSLPSPE